MNELLVHLADTIEEVYLINGKLLMVIYLGILNDVWTCSKKDNGSTLL